MEHRLEDARKSFDILYGMKHYGSCISLLCQELNQVVRVLYLLNTAPTERNRLIEFTLNDKKWYVAEEDRKKKYITDETFAAFANSFDGWEKAICEFGDSFRTVSSSLTHPTKDPVSALGSEERDKIHRYIASYHDGNFPENFTIEQLNPILPRVFDRIAERLREYSIHL